ncbi:hypothetical protein GGI43DRAFT_111966 [Trichoderma evansii]
MPYYIWTTLRTMPPISFPIFPSLNAICPASLYLYCVFNYQLFKHSAAAWHGDFHIILSSNKPMAAKWLALYGMTNTVPFLVLSIHHSLATFRLSR